ncbi:serine hydrolase domain-containing protein [Pseudoalteromonas rubra]|uniref:serine hydrolase domain-containing protein n=1 Tax=Pseudoalteromonas rubra TaxID=43658 RepID=UPI000AEE875F|nr:serine hydrolase domain-containing protein [Pseudoalteromonas rubra]
MNLHPTKKQILFAEAVRSFLCHYINRLSVIRHLLTCCVLLSTVLFYSQSSLAKPAENAEELIHEFIRVMNDKQQASVVKFVDHHMAQSSIEAFGGEGRARYIGYITGERRFHGFLELDTIEPLSTHNGTERFRIRVKSRNTDLWYNLTMTMPQQSPNKLANFYLQPTSHPNEENSKISKTELISQVRHYINSLTAKGLFSGAILIADTDTVLYQDAKGFTNLERTAKNNVDTKFNLASMNKMFTAVGILQLVEQQKMSLDDKLIKFIDPAMFPAGEFDQITVRQLLSHTAGLGWSQAPDTEQSSGSAEREVTKNFKHLTLAATPGGQFRYSNDGMVLLGEIIEKVSGKSYYRYIREYIYQPAGMIHSDSYDPKQAIENMAIGYYYDAEQQKSLNNLEFMGTRGGAAGGGFSTVVDLHKFSQALTQYKLLSKALTQAAYSAKPELHSPGYGYGFSTQGEQGNRIIGHSGGSIGVSSRLSIYLDQGITLAILCNKNFVSEPVVWKVNQLVRRLNN